MPYVSNNSVVFYMIIVYLQRSKKYRYQAVKQKEQSKLKRRKTRL